MSNANCFFLQNKVLYPKFDTPFPNKPLAESVGRASWHRVWMGGNSGCWKIQKYLFQYFCQNVTFISDKLRQHILMWDNIVWHLCWKFKLIYWQLKELWIISYTKWEQHPPSPIYWSLNINFNMDLF